VSGPLYCARLSPSAGLTAIVLILAVSWLAALTTASHSTARGSDGAAALAAGAVYVAGSFICHQRPERSFHPWGVRMPVCARCVGLYAAAPLGIAVALLGAVAGAQRRPRVAGTGTRVLLGLAAVPTVATVLVEWLGWVEPSSSSRALASLPLGAAVGWLAGAFAAGDLR
jgi:uncharacterized membrane protein